MTGILELALLMAQAAPAGAAAWPFVNILVAIVVVAAAVAIVVIFLRYTGITIPPIVVQCFWICFAAVVAILAIKFIVGLF
jgi:hypothetical protein